MYKISLSEMQIFLLTSKYHSFSKAAEVLYISQPTVTKWIHHLEKELGVKLFHRTSRSVELTTAGELLKDRWKPLLAEIEASIHDTQELAANGLSTIQIGALEGHDFEQILSDYVFPFEELHPEIQIDFNIYNLHELTEQIENLDIIFSNNLEYAAANDHAFLRLGDLPFYLAVSKEHRFARKKSITMEELAAEKFLIFPPRVSPVAIQYAVSAFKFLNLTPQFIPVENTPSQLLRISQNRGVAIVSASAVKSYQKKISLIRIKDFPFEYYRLIMYRPQKLSSATRRFLAYLTEQFPADSQCTHNYSNPRKQTMSLT